ncbi:MAG: fimbria/pilus periplasmic chaperone [Neisseriaceae bacterium]|nr:fimbria/pilus periplasmic chaperone [Neisseriaceae bacterium]
MKNFSGNLSNNLTELVLIFVFGFMLSNNLHAMGLQVSPISIELDPKQLAQKIWLSNNGDNQTQAQIRIYRWTQDASKDTLTPTQDLVLSPPMLTILPGEKKLVRLIKISTDTNTTEPLIEKSYRMVVNEVPTAATKNNKTISFVAEYSIPVFLYNGNNEQFKPEIALSFLQNNEDLSLQVTNSGNMHAKLSAVEFINNKGQKTLINSGLLGYVLPGQTRLWNINPSSHSPNQEGMIEFNLNDKKVSRDILSIINK